MALTQCPDCNGELSTEAIACPHCGRPNHPGSNDALKVETPRKGGREWVPGNNARCPHCGRESPIRLPRLMVIIGGLLGICLVLGALGSIVAAVGKPNRPSPTTKKPTPVADTGSQVVHPSPAVGVNPVRVTAAQLLHAYQDNSVSADATYRGAWLLVDGSISWVDRDFLGHVVLHLRAGENFDSVMATVNEADTKKAVFLKKGERVVLLCTGKTRMGSAALEDCRL